GFGGDGITKAAVVTILTSAPATDAQVVLFANGAEVGRAPSGGAVSFPLTLAGGEYTLVAPAIDTAGDVSFFTAPVALTIDRTLALPPIALDALFAAPIFGPGLHTTSEVVTFTGKTEANTIVTIDGTPVLATAESLGNFRLTDVQLHPGVNVLTFRATDVAGN